MQNFIFQRIKPVEIYQKYNNGVLIFHVVYDTLKLNKLSVIRLLNQITAELKGNGFNSIKKF